MHTGLLLLDLLDDEERSVEEPIDAVLETRCFRTAELARQTAGDTSKHTQGWFSQMGAFQNESTVEEANNSRVPAFVRQLVNGCLHLCL